ncbi:MAG: hypothetical protein AB8B91_16220 [Rubripirellula sp.]
MVVLRGAIEGQLADDVATRAIIAMLIYAGIGWVAGWVADYLVRDAVEQMFRKRVEWYREGLIELGDNNETTVD